MGHDRARPRAQRVHRGHFGRAPASMCTPQASGTGEQSVPTSKSTALGLRVQLCNSRSPNPASTHTRAHRAYVLFLSSSSGGFQIPHVQRAALARCAAPLCRALPHSQQPARACTIILHAMRCDARRHTRRAVTTACPCRPCRSMHAHTTRREAAAATKPASTSTTATRHPRHTRRMHV